MKISGRKKIISIALITVLTGISIVMMNGCKVPESIANKSGAQLWGENCIRCHNTPDPKTYSDDQWDAACEHMRQKAILTDVEITKIKAFLKSAN
ncbi:MAG: cytochrome c [Bacteroidia bacterium]